ncbi:MAG: hypothetical protein V7720_03230 [Halioglobus sp.]
MPSINNSKSDIDELESHMRTFAPDAATIPSHLETTDFRIRMLKITDVVKDYDAVMSSVEHLRGVFGPKESWPEGLTLEQDLIDLGWHQKEFELRRSFAYTVMSLDESRCLGCVYVDPSEKTGYDAMVVLWVRQSEAQSGLDEALFSAVKKWLAEKWWFSLVAFPGRDFSWQHWESLPDKRPY